MLNLLLCECAKLRRRPLFFLAAAISGLIPLGCALFLPDFRNISDGAEAVEAVMSALFQLSASLLLLPALGVIGSVLFFQEEESDTLKNLLTVPVTKSALAFAKLAVLFLF